MKVNVSTLLNGYLPLSGGTLNGTLTLRTEGTCLQLTGSNNPFLYLLARDGGGFTIGSNTTELYIYSMQKKGNMATFSQSANMITLHGNVSVQGSISATGGVQGASLSQLTENEVKELKAMLGSKNPQQISE